jgi:hypothetical protein
MSEAEAWEEFRKGERVVPTQRTCWMCLDYATGDIVDEQGDCLCDECAKDDEILGKAIVAGWTYQSVLLYEEEGAEGFLWTSPEGKDCTALAKSGDSKSSEVPKAIRLLFDEEYKAERAKLSQEKSQFADFLDDLLL